MFIKKLNGIYTLTLLINLLFYSELYPQSDLTENRSDKTGGKIFYMTLSGGIHGGDGRFAWKPIGFIGAGFFINKGLNLKFEYTPIIVKVKSDIKPEYVYNGEELEVGRQVTLNEYFLTAEKKIIYNFWLTLGFAPEKKFSIRLGMKYRHTLNNYLIIFGAYDLLLIGRPIYNTPAFFIPNNSFMIGIDISLI